MAAPKRVVPKRPKRLEDPKLLHIRFDSSLRDFCAQVATVLGTSDATSVRWLIEFARRRGALAAAERAAAKAAKSAERAAVRAARRRSNGGVA